MRDEIPPSAQQPGEELEDWVKRRNKAAKDKIEDRKLEEARILEEKRLEEERLETERQEKEPMEKIRGASDQGPRLLPPGGVEEAAREGVEKVLEEFTGEPTQIRVPEGFEVTRLIYGRDGEPTAVYIDRKTFNWRTMAIGVILGTVISLFLTAFMILPPWEIFNWGGL